MLFASNLSDAALPLLDVARAGVARSTFTGINRWNNTNMFHHRSSASFERLFFFLIFFVGICHCLLFVGLSCVFCRFSDGFLIGFLFDYSFPEPVACLFFFFVNLRKVLKLDFFFSNFKGELDGGARRSRCGSRERAESWRNRRRWFRQRNESLESAGARETVQNSREWARFRQR